MVSLEAQLPPSGSSRCTIKYMSTKNRRTKSNGTASFAAQNIVLNSRFSELF